MAADTFDIHNKSIFDNDNNDGTVGFTNPLLGNLEDSGAEDNNTQPEQDNTTIDPLEYYAAYNNPMDNMWQGSSFDDAEEASNIYHSEEFEEAVSMYFDVHDKKVTKFLASLNEADQTSLLRSLTSKLYDIIVKKIDKIDYGDIPKSKGDITKVTNFNMTCECVDLIRRIVEQFNENTDTIDIINTAISNMNARTPVFRSAFMKKNEFIMNLYCNTVLAIIAATSYMSSTCIEFIKSPGQETFDMCLDRVAYTKSKDALLLTTLQNFNNSCKNGDFDKACEAAMSNKMNEGAVLTAMGTKLIATVGIPALIGIILVSILPFLRSLAYYFFCIRTKISDYFYIQANILEAHALRLQASDTSDVANKDEVVIRQLKIVDTFRKIANKFAITNKKAEVDSYKEISDEDKRMKPELDASGSPSAIF